MSKDKFLLVKGIAGLGNRMFCAVTSILYARLTGRRLLVDWSDETYSPDGSNVFHRFFLCPWCNPTDEIPATDSVRPSVWRGHLRERAENMRKPYRGHVEFWQHTSIDLARLDYQEDVLVMWAFHEKVDLLRNHFTGAFQEFSQTSTKAILRKLLREDLILQPWIRARVEQFKRDNFRQKTVGVHVRYTDHRVRLWAILQKLHLLLKREPELQIFLATDNIQITILFEENFPGTISTPHAYPAPGFCLHGRQQCPDLVEHGVEALVDLYLLAECEYLIVDTSSSFAHMATLLTKTPDSRVFDVKQGGKYPVRLRHFTWQMMLRLGLFSWGLDLVRKLVRFMPAPIEEGKGK